jgi:hypothetical protein
MIGTIGTFQTNCPEFNQFGSPGVLGPSGVRGTLGNGRGQSSDATTIASAGPISNNGGGFSVAGARIHHFPPPELSPNSVKTPWLAHFERVFSVLRGGANCTFRVQLWHLRRHTVSLASRTELDLLA